MADCGLDELPLQKRCWFLRVHRAIGVTQKVRLVHASPNQMAMHTGSFATKLKRHGRGWMKRYRWQRHGTCTSTCASVAFKGLADSGKVAVIGLLERHGEVRTMVVSNVKRKQLHGENARHVEAVRTVYSEWI